MPKIYTAYCLVLLSFFAYAAHNGLVYASYFSGDGQVNKTANHYHK